MARRPPTRVSPMPAAIRRATEGVRELLRQPLPDTFLGRRTQEPFPEDNADPDQDDVPPQNDS